MKKQLLCLLSCIIFILPAAHAGTNSPLPVQFTLTHIAADKWRADYLLAEPVESINLGPKVGEYRKQAWRILTPGVTLVEQPDQESVSGGGKSFSAFSVEVSLFLPFAEKAYTAFDRMSDGGTTSSWASLRAMLYKAQTSAHCT